MLCCIDGCILSGEVLRKTNLYPSENMLGITRRFVFLTVDKSACCGHLKEQQREKPQCILVDFRVR
jgi:hypothetical protein